jgi:hypothetical protein
MTKARVTLRRTVAAVLVAVLLPGAALSQPALEPILANRPDAPFKITGCTGSLGKDDYGFEHLKLRATLQNIGQRRIVAMKMTVITLTAFNDVQQNFDFEADEQMAPYEIVSADWETQVLYDTTRALKCIPYMAKFSDASTWTNDMKYKPPKARRATPAPHPKTCYVRTRDGGEMEIPWTDAECLPRKKPKT